MYKLNKIFLSFLIIFILLVSTTLPLITANNINNNKLYDNYINDAFTVHKFSSNSENKYYLNKNNYYIDIASSNNKNFYLNISSNNFSFRMYTNNWEFHGFYINKSGIYYFNTSGSGKWILSMSAQDPGYIYDFNVSVPTSFVIVPEMISQNRIEIKENSNYKMILYNSLLNPVKTSTNGKIYYNITEKQYNGVDFVTLFINKDTIISLSWGTFHVNNNFSSKYNFVEIIAAMFIILISLSVYIIFKRNHKNKKRR